MMRITYLTLFMTVMFITNYPLDGYGAYIIKMKNGRQFSASRYWEDGSKIVISINSGTLGFEKRFVKEIRKNDEYRKDGSFVEVVQKVQKTKTETPKPTEENQTLEENNEQSTNKKNDEDKYVKEFNEIKELYKNIQMMTTEEIYAFSSTLEGFKKKIINSDESHLYREVLNEAYLIGDEMESILKTRVQ